MPAGSDVGGGIVSPGGFIVRTALSVLRGRTSGGRANTPAETAAATAAGYTLENRNPNRGPRGGTYWYSAAGQLIGNDRDMRRYLAAHPVAPLAPSPASPADQRIPSLGTPSWAPWLFDYGRGPKSRGRKKKKKTPRVPQVSPLPGPPPMVPCGSDSECEEMYPDIPPGMDPMPPRDYGAPDDSPVQRPDFLRAWPQFSGPKYQKPQAPPHLKKKKSYQFDAPIILPPPPPTTAFTTPYPGIDVPPMVLPSILTKALPWLWIPGAIFFPSETADDDVWQAPQPHGPRHRGRKPRPQPYGWPVPDWSGKWHPYDVPGFVKPQPHETPQPVEMPQPVFVPDPTTYPVAVPTAQPFPMPKPTPAPTTWKIPTWIGDFAPLLLTFALPGSKPGRYRSPLTGPNDSPVPLASPNYFQPPAQADTCQCESQGKRKKRKRSCVNKVTSRRTYKKGSVRYRTTTRRITCPA
jgi:hypothetical protein